VREAVARLRQALGTTLEAHGIRAPQKRGFAPGAVALNRAPGSQPGQAEQGRGSQLRGAGQRTLAPLMWPRLAKTAGANRRMEQDLLHSKQLPLVVGWSFVSAADGERPYVG